MRNSISWARALAGGEARLPARLCFWALLAVAHVLPGCSAGHETQPATSTPPPARTVLPGDDGNRDEGAAAREAFARQLTADLAATDDVVFTATGPDGRHLTVDNQPACNENTMVGMLPLAPRLRQLGFDVVTCHGERAVGYLVPDDGSLPTVFDKRSGWYCGDHDVGIPASCWRTREQCALVHDACTYRQQPVQCTIIDGLRPCFATSEDCFAHRRIEVRLGHDSPECFEVP